MKNHKFNLHKLIKANLNNYNIMLNSNYNNNNNLNYLFMRNFLQNKLKSILSIASQFKINS